MAAQPCDRDTFSIRTHVRQPQTGKFFTLAEAGEPRKRRFLTFAGAGEPGKTSFLTLADVGEPGKRSFPTFAGVGELGKRSFFTLAGVGEPRKRSFLTFAGPGEPGKRCPSDRKYPPEPLTSICLEVNYAKNWRNSAVFPATDMPRCPLIPRLRRRQILPMHRKAAKCPQGAGIGGKGQSGSSEAVGRRSRTAAAPSQSSELK